MATAHNLSLATDNLSGFDPTVGITDGTTIGKSYLLRKIFEGLLSFDSNIKEITASAPTPVFLQPEVSTLTSLPAVNRSIATDYIQFYHANDSGLTQTPPHAIVYRWSFNISYNSLINTSYSHKVSGSALWIPSGQVLGSFNDTPANASIGSSFTSTTTSNNAVPKTIFWKSGNCNMMMGITKGSGVFSGMHVWINPVPTGYQRDTGDITLSTYRNSIFLNGVGGAAFIEPFNRISESNLSAVTSGLHPLCSVGALPSNLFTLSGQQRIIGGKLKFGLVNALFKTVTEEIEGIVLASPSVLGLIGTISQYNGINYLIGGAVSDAKSTYRVIFPLVNG